MFKQKMLVLILGVILSFGAFAGTRSGGFSSGSRSFSSGSSSRGGFSSSRPSAPSYSRPNTSSTGSRSSTTTTTTTRSYSRSYGGAYIHPYGGYYGGWGMGYGYNNGLITGLIIGSMMHPQGTVMYNGPGMYNNQALLYPNGQVVDGSNGVLVGTYTNGQFNQVQGGGVVAQTVPSDAIVQGQGPQQISGQPVVVVQQHENNIGAYVILTAIVIGIVVMVILIIG